MHRPKESFGDMLLKLPWWISAVMGILSITTMTGGLLIWAGHDNTRLAIARAIIPFSSIVFAFFGIHAAASYWFGRRCERLIEEQTSLESLRNVPWKQFEFMVAEAYRRQGYAVDYSFSRGADGGVDLILRRNGQTSLVQCKQWKINPVSVKVIREMFGLLTAEKADETIIITTGKFSSDAISFAIGKPIQLIDGPQLLELVRSVQNQTKVEVETDTGKREQGPPACPKCGKTMVLRTAKRGANAGNDFWGCSTYPGCKGVLSSVDRLPS